MVQKDAIERKGLTQLLFEPETLPSWRRTSSWSRRCSSARGPDPRRRRKETAREIVREVVDELRKKLETEMRDGDPRRGAPRPHTARSSRCATSTGSARSARTSRAGTPRTGAWCPIASTSGPTSGATTSGTSCILVDQSGSMAESVVYSSVMAAIFASLDVLRTRLVFFDKVIQDERLYALGFCDLQDRLLYQTLTFPDQLSCESLGHLSAGSSEVVKLRQGPLHVMSSTIQFNGRPTGRLMLVHDMSFVHQRSTDTKWYVFYLFTGLAALISLVTVLVAHISWRGWIAGVRALLDRGGLPGLRRKIHSPELHPVAHDLNELVRELEADRRMRDESQITWSPASLKTILHEHLSGDEILIVSNREPYIHTKRGKNRRAVAGEWIDFRLGAGYARLLRRLDCSWQRICGS